MPKVKGKEVQAKPIYWIIFLTPKIIIIVLFIIFLLSVATDILDGFWPL